MESFEAQIDAVAAYVRNLTASGKPSREFFCPSSPDDLKQGLPVRVGPGANPGIILRGNTFVELGNPTAGSCAFVLWTKQPSHLCDGKLTLIGPDIAEAEDASLPFAQVLLAAGENLDAAAHPTLAQAQYVGDQIEGYMVRSSSQNIWSRVSREAAAKGFCFETLGRALMALYKSSMAKVNAMEIVFITSGKDDVLGLEPIAKQVRQIGKEIVNEHWKSKGYDLECDLNCSSCHDKDVCDDVREVIAVRRKNKGKKVAADAAS